MARTVRPWTLAAVFGAFFLIVAYAAWSFAQGLTGVWYRGDITRWVYTTYMLVAAIFLVGLGGLALTIRRSLGRRIRELSRHAGSTARKGLTDELPPPLPETPAGDAVDRDIDELLRSLSEIESSAQAMEAEAEEEAAAEAVGAEAPMHESNVWLKERLEERRRLLSRYILGPGLVASAILAVSGMMLPGAEGFAQSNFRLNTAVILGIGYSWGGLGAYISATIAVLVSRRMEGAARET